MPVPESGESLNEYIPRCMGDPAMVHDYPDPDQRYQVCLSIYESEGRDDKTGNHDGT